MKPNRRPRPVHSIPSQWIGIRKGWRQSYRTAAQALVSLSAEDLKLHMYVVGASGSGKTVLLHHVIAQLMARRESIVILDARGDLCKAVVELAYRLGVDPSTFKFINLRDKQQLGFNPLAGAGEAYFRALAVLDAIAAQSESWGVQLAEYLRNALLVLAETGSALTMLEPLFYDPKVRQELLSRVKTESLRSFWERYHAQGPARQEALAAPVINKASLLLSTEPLKRLFGSSNPIDLAHQLNTPGSVTIISLAVDELHSAGLMAGSIFLSAVSREVFSRTDTAESTRNNITLLVDEYQHFDAEIFEAILAEGRRYKIRAVLAHQDLSQISPKTRSMVLTNVGVKAVFRTSYQSAEILNKDLTGDSKAFDLPNLGVGEAVLWKRGQAPVEIEVNSPLIRDVGQLSAGAQAYLKQVQSFYPPNGEESTANPNQPSIEEDSGDQPDADWRDWL